MNDHFKKPANPKHEKGADKVSRIPIKIVQPENILRKPKWIRTKAPTGEKVNKIRKLLRTHKLNTVCEDASCPNLGECFSNGTATFMIMGDICTRRCPFCDVAHGKPDPLDTEEPDSIANAVKLMNLNYVVLTSVDRDDLRDGGAEHFNQCMQAIRDKNENIKIEILVPDFRGRMDIAIDILSNNAPDVFNHNLETVPRLYKECRPGADYQWSLKLLKKYKESNPKIITKSGLMLGLGENNQEILEVMQDMRDHNINMLTLGQYLQPSRSHLPVKRYVHPDDFAMFEQKGLAMGFDVVSSGAMVRSSYHADIQSESVT